MPWRCPACHIAIRHSDLEDRPRLHALYRCHICRLELVLDDQTNKLVVAPLTTNGADPDEPPRRDARKDAAE